MKLILLTLCCLLIASSLYAQDTDSTKTSEIDTTNKTTLTFQPIVGLGLFNGGRVGLGIKLNEFIAVEAGFGLDAIASLSALTLFLLPIDPYGRALSEGIIFTPFAEKRLSFIFYNTYISKSANESSNYWQAMIGWKIQTGDLTALRISAGYTKKYAGNSMKYKNVNLSLDFVLTYDAFKVSW
ncbi:MAG: hypothetical protein JST20_09395 [Bacteroidetes bacterium]|nr:hypothetical protein [Bacteroidota bacterium]